MLAALWKLFCSVPWNGGNSSHHSPLLGYPAKNTYSQTTILSPTRRTWHAHIMVNTSSDQQRQPNHQTHLVRGCKFINRLLRHAPALPFQTSSTLPLPPNLNQKQGRQTRLWSAQLVRQKTTQLIFMQHLDI
jgi:hypothetical protein